ncbi:MAG: glycosyltransferase [Clostridia bacterium]
MKKILIIMGRYLPGYKDGGPVRSIKNLTDFLGDEYEFNILTCDRDHGDVNAYPNIKVNAWNKVDNANVYYVSPKGFKLAIIKELSNKNDLVYICGCFNDYAINTLILKRLDKIKVPVVVASMGLFSPMEFNLKYRKKKTFTTVFNVLGLFKNIYWSATSNLEISEIKQQVKSRDNQFLIAEDLPRKVKNIKINKTKNINALEVTWISRITHKKNLQQAINILSTIKYDIKFTIYGPIHTQEYWYDCQKSIKKLPSNIKCEYKGNVESENVVKTLSNHHVFLFPTLGENYGHVIQEALSAGCPCILSDQTPWKNLEENDVGFVCELSDENKFIKAIEYYAKMNEQEFNKVAQSALDYAITNSNDKVKNTGYRKIFELG